MTQLTARLTWATIEHVNTAKEAELLRAHDTIRAKLAYHQEPRRYQEKIDRFVREYSQMHSVTPEQRTKILLLFGLKP